MHQANVARSAIAVRCVRDALRSMCSSPSLGNRDKPLRRTFVPCTICDTAGQKLETSRPRAPRRRVQRKLAVSLATIAQRPPRHYFVAGVAGASTVILTGLPPRRPILSPNTKYTSAATMSAPPSRSGCRLPRKSHQPLELPILLQEWKQRGEDRKVSEHKK